MSRGGESLTQNHKASRGAGGYFGGRLPQSWQARAYRSEGYQRPKCESDGAKDSTSPSGAELAVALSADRPACIR